MMFEKYIEWKKDCMIHVAVDIFGGTVCASSGDNLTVVFSKHDNFNFSVFVHTLHSIFFIFLLFMNASSMSMISTKLKQKYDIFISIISKRQVFTK
jgi:hypothetical protein